MFRPFVPPYLLERLAESGRHRFVAASETAAATLRHEKKLRHDTESRRDTERPPADPPAAAPARSGVAGPDRTISDAAGGVDLPGKPARHEGEPPTGDPAVDEAYDGFGATYALYAEVYDWNSLDGNGFPLDGTVHFGQNYDNAFWDGRRMVFGDGDGEVFNRFTKSLTVIGHELTHGVTQSTVNLRYDGQSGALNESISDVFGVLVEQYLLGQTADRAAWLVGAGLFTAHVHGVAMRSLREPGSAYDDDVLGKDPQPAHMDRYVETLGDNGGVHINSGIPNHAFYLVATALGGYAWERAGRIWFQTVTGGGLDRSADFATFATRTATVATALFGAGSAESRAVRAGWRGVGIDA